MVAPRGDMHGCSGGCAWLLQGDVCGCSGGGGVWLLLGGMHGDSRGACVVAAGGACMVAPGGHVWDMTRYRDTINERAGTHPTGMHSC